MVGRGCRAQGQGQGILFFKGDPYAKKDAWEHLQVKDRSHRDPGGGNLRVLFANSKEITQKEIDKIAVAFQYDNWKCNATIFESAFSQGSDTLTKVDKRRVANLK